MMHAILSEKTIPLYEAARRAAKGEPNAKRPLMWDDLDGFIQPMVEGTHESISSRGAIIEAVQPITASLRDFAG